MMTLILKTKFSVHPGKVNFNF